MKMIQKGVTRQMLSKENLALYAFQKYGDTALQAAFCCIGNRADAEDIAQEIFFSLHRQPRDFADDDHLKVWILRTVINRSRCLHKNLLRRVHINMDHFPTAAVTVQDSAEREIVNLITSLPQPCAEVVYLHDYENYTVREIAQLLNRTETTVSLQLQRGHGTLCIERPAELAGEV